VNLRTFGGAPRVYVEEELHLRLGQVGRAAARAGCRWGSWISRKERGGVHVVLGRIPDGDEPTWRALLVGIGAFADAGIRVNLMVLEYAPDAGLAINGLRDRGLLPAAATVKCFWQEAAPSGDGGAYSPPLGGLPQQAAAIRLPGHNARTIYMHDGLPVLAVLDEGGAITVEHLGPMGTSRQRDEYDDRSRLVRILDMIEESGAVATRRYLDADGACWLSEWVDQSSGVSGPFQLHRPKPREFATDRDVYAWWVATEIQQSAAPLIISVDKIGAHVVAKSFHPCAYRVTLQTDRVPWPDPESLLAFYAYAVSRTLHRRSTAAVEPPSPLTSCPT
jgi:hypothetical protein